MSNARFWKTSACVGMALAWGSLPAVAQDPSPWSEVIVRTIDADSLRGRLTTLSLARGAVLHIPTEGKLHIPIEDLVRVTLVDGRISTAAKSDRVELASGDRIHGRIVGGSETTIRLKTADLGELDFPLEDLRRIRMARGLTPAYRESAEWFESSGDGAEDAVLLTNGDVITGFVTSMSDEYIGVDATMGEARIEHRLIVAVRFAAGDTATLALPRLVISLRDGSRVTADAFELVGNSAEARIPTGEEISVQVARIAKIDVVGGRWEWLSGKRPVSEEQIPMLSLPWEYRNDRNVRGGPITVAGRRYDFGIGVHSRSTLIYELKGAYRQFVTAFGLDDDSGRFADIDAFILVDGKRRFGKRHVQPGELFGPVRVDVSQANRLELIVDFGANGDIQDRFNWVEAALIRADAVAQP